MVDKENKSLFIKKMKSFLLLKTKGYRLLFYTKEMNLLLDIRRKCGLL